MRNKLIKISRIFFVVILAFLSMLIIFHRPKTETNILKAIFSNNEKVIVDLSTKFSAKINVIVEVTAPKLQKQPLKIITDK